MKNNRLATLIGSALLMISLLTGCTFAQSLDSGGLLPAVKTAPTAQAEVQTAPAEENLAGDGDFLAAVQATFQQIYRDVNPSVVNIQVLERIGQMQTGGEGSGFVWDTDGHIVTNNHVVENASQITVVFTDGTTVEAEVVGADPESDLAVIKIDPVGLTLTPLTLADSRKVQVGDLVIAIGNPYGLSGTMTQGIVSALSRSLRVNDSETLTTGSYSIPDIIQTDAAINPGNSGGVLVDVNGQVIGVTAAIASTSNANAGIGFVIPSHIVGRVVPVLITNGEYQHPRIGVTGTTLTASLAEDMGLDANQKGVLVISVREKSPAETGGLRGSSEVQGKSGQTTYTGGDVITAVDGQPIDTMDGLISYLFNETEVGNTITLTVLRDGKEISVEITLADLS